MADPYDDDDEDVYTPAPAGTAKNDMARGFLRQYEERGAKSAATYEDIMRQRGDVIARVKRDLDATIGEMKAKQSGEGPGQINLPLLALGAGLLSPEPGGRVGNFGSELSRGLTAMGSTIAAQRKGDADFGARLAQLQQKSGELEDLPLRDRATLARQEQLNNENQRARIEAAMIRADAVGAGKDTAEMKNFSLWKQSPGNENKSYQEYIEWKARVGANKDASADQKKYYEWKQDPANKDKSFADFVAWEARTKSKEREFGKSQGEKDAGLPATMQDLDYIDETIARIEQHPGSKNAFGMMSLVPNRPGSKTSDFDNLRKQLESQTFLTAVQKMRGLGALTEMEGKKVTDAVAALQTTQSEEQFRENLKILKGYLAKSRSVAMQAAGKEPRAVDEKPPMEGARKAADGKWYIEKGGKYFRVGE